MQNTIAGNRCSSILLINMLFVDLFIRQACTDQNPASLEGQGAGPPCNPGPDIRIAIQQVGDNPFSAGLLTAQVPSAREAHRLTQILMGELL